MTTVASRVFRSSPFRGAPATREAIVAMLTTGEGGPARNELLSVTGIASAIIADRGPEKSAIVVTCDGPRTRVYCTYDDQAIDGSDAKEDSLGYDAMQGGWAISLPCPKDDLTWVQRALAVKSQRITARDMTSTLGDEQGASAKTQDFTVDMKAVLES